MSRVEQAQGHNYLISYLWKVALIIQYMQNTGWFTGNEIYDWLVVLVIYVSPFYLLLGILLLLQSEDVLVKEELQSLVGVVDTQLFKTVDMEVLQWEEKNTNV